MKQFKSVEDLEQLSPDDPAYPIVAELVQRLIADYQAEGYPYDPEADGWIVLIDEGDADRVLTEIWDDWRLVDVWWEGISRRGGHYLGIYLANNQFGLCFVIPDAHWVNGELREVLEHHCEGETA